MSQQIFRFDRVGTVNISQPAEPAQSKDEIIKARIEPRNMDQVRAFCSGRQITVSDYVRRCLHLDPAYFDLIETLNEYRSELLPLLNRMPRKF